MFAKDIFSATSLSYKLALGSDLYIENLEPNGPHGSKSIGKW